MKRLTVPASHECWHLIHAWAATWLRESQEETAAVPQRGQADGASDSALGTDVAR